ncbi:hypothetical protein [Microvirga yunnanensis]|uniref:hypothetical protein n=1 Tax=Microvirga yunnanensis TaxID=2953740 RepID=UPI0021C8ADF1|nr:hypothetical protein [Microvirga sp. HBU65207]
MINKPTTATSQVMTDQMQPDPGLPNDLMSEAEVALRLAEFILSLSGSGAMAGVAIDGAGINVGSGLVFDIGRFMVATGWVPVKEAQVSRSAWTGAYRRDDKTVRVHARPGHGNVVAQINGRRIVAVCTEGPQIRKPGGPEPRLLTTALGQALLLDIVADDIVITAVPDTPVFRQLAETWRSRPLIRRAHIQLALVHRDGTVSGLNL